MKVRYEVCDIVEVVNQSGNISVQGRKLGREKRSERVLVIYALEQSAVKGVRQTTKLFRALVAASPYGNRASARYHIRLLAHCQCRSMPPRTNQ